MLQASDSPSDRKPSVSLHQHCGGGDDAGDRGGGRRGALVKGKALSCRSDPPLLGQNLPTIPAAINFLFSFQRDLNRMQSRLERYEQTLDSRPSTVPIVCFKIPETSMLRKHVARGLSKPRSGERHPRGVLLASFLLPT